MCGPEFCLNHVVSCQGISPVALHQFTDAIYLPSIYYKLPGTSVSWGFSSASGTVGVTDLGAVHQNLPSPLVCFYALKTCGDDSPVSQLAGSKTLFFFSF